MNAAENEKAISDFLTPYRERLGASTFFTTRIDAMSREDLLGLVQYMADETSRGRSRRLEELTNHAFFSAITEKHR